jgi:uncharacterized membrane protein
MTQIFIQFVFYSLLGWLMESVYVSAFEKRWINRGFLNGPICPIYGFGALLVLFTFGRFQGHWLMVFVGAIFLSSSLEFLTSWLMEKLFNNRWWDYSHHRFNLQGRISLQISLAWGVLCLIVVYGVAPIVDRAIALVPALILNWIAVVSAIIIAVDLWISVSGTLRLNRLLDQLYQMTLGMRQKSEQVADDWQKRLGTLAGGLREWRILASRTNYVQRRLLRAFPRLYSLRNPETLNRLRRWLRFHQRQLRFPDVDLMLLRDMMAMPRTMRRKRPDEQLPAGKPKP